MAGTKQIGEMIARVIAGCDCNGDRMSKQELIGRMNEHMKTILPKWNMSIFAAKANEREEPSHVYDEELGAHVPTPYHEEILRYNERDAQISARLAEERIEVPHSPIIYGQQMRWRQLMENIQRNRERIDPRSIAVGVCTRCEIGFDSRQLYRCSHCTESHCDPCMRAHLEEIGDL